MGSSKEEIGIITILRRMGSSKEEIGIITILRGMGSPFKAV